MNIRLSLTEIFLLELGTWLIIWLSSDYIGSLLTLIVGSIVFSVLVIAILAELIEKSNVPRRYFKVMVISVIAPILAAIIHLFIFGGQLTFLQQP